MGGPTAARRWMVGSSVTCRSISRAHTPRPVGSARAPRSPAHPSVQGRVAVTPIAATTNRGQTLRALVAFSELRPQGGADPRKPCIHLTVQAHNLGRRVTRPEQRLNLPPQGLHLGVRLLRRLAALLSTPTRAAPRHRIDMTRKSAM